MKENVPAKHVPVKKSLIQFVELMALLIQIPVRLIVQRYVLLYITEINEHD